MNEPTQNVNSALAPGSLSLRAVAEKATWFHGWPKAGWVLIRDGQAVEWCLHLYQAPQDVPGLLAFPQDDGPILECRPRPGGGFADWTPVKTAR